MNAPSLFGVVRRSVLLYAHVDKLVSRLVNAYQSTVEAFLSECLTPEEMTSLGIALYNRAPQRYLSMELFDWEREWFAKRLPAAPARILVGAAGSGRESMALAAQGYQIDAFEPAPKMMQLCHDLLPAPHRVVQATYEDFWRAVLDRQHNAMSPMAGGGYDAVILGWGSVSHVLQPTDRIRLIQAASKVAPRGPVLVSYRTDAHLGLLQGPGHRLGRVLAKPIGRFRPRVPFDTRSIRFSTQLGFGAFLSVEEIENIAKIVQRLLLWEEKPSFPHFTLVPR